MLFKVKLLPTSADLLAEEFRGTFRLHCFGSILASRPRTENQLWRNLRGKRAFKNCFGSKTFHRNFCHTPVWTCGRAEWGCTIEERDFSKYCEDCDDELCTKCGGYYERLSVALTCTKVRKTGILDARMFISASETVNGCFSIRIRNGRFGRRNGRF